MVTDFQDSVVKALANDDVDCKNYFGELKEPKSYQAPIDFKPIIYVNYTKDEPIKDNFIRSKYLFDLYIVHTAFSSNEKTRMNTHKDIHSVMKHIRTSLQLKSFNGSEPIVLARGEKIFDAPANSRYLTVYKRSFEVILEEQF